MKTFALTLTLGLIVGIAQAGTTDLKDIRHRLNLYEHGVQGIADSVPLSQTDLLALNEKLDFDPEAITRFVRKDISLESYPGLLRGAKGTLMAQAGNALDQCVLLATLLGDSGYDVRIKRGKLPPDDARRLAASMFKRSPTTDAIDHTALNAALQDIAKAAGKRGKTIKAASAWTNPLALPPELRDANERVDKRLLDIMQPVSDWSNSTQTADTLLAEISDYFWLEYRMGPQDDWHVAQPAFGVTDAPIKLPDATQTLTSTIPRQLQHRIRIELKMERIEGGRLKTENLMNRFERPAANMVDVPLTITLAPSKLLSNPSAPADEILKSQFFIPYFNNHKAPDSQAFTRDGLLVDAGDLAQGGGAAAVFGSLAAETNKGVGALAGAGSKKGKGGFALGGVYIEVTRIAPGGKEKTQRHYLLDLIDPATRDRKQVAVRDLPKNKILVPQLAATTTLMVGVGRQKAEYALRAFAHRLQLSATGYRLAVLKAHAPDTPQTADVETLTKLPHTWPLAAIFTSILMHTDASSDRIAYRPGPTIALHRRDTILADKPLKIIDILANPIRAYALRPTGTIVWDAKAAFHQGVRDTFAEHALSGSRSENAAAFVAQSGSTIRVIDTKEKLTAARIDSGAAKRAMQTDLENGYILLLPEKQVGALPTWWRVNPTNGQSLGMIGPGLGGDVEEYLVTDLISDAISGAFYINTLNQCTHSKSPACCFAKAAILQAGGIAAGEIAGAMIVDKVASGILGITVGLSYNTASLGVPSGCSFP